MNGQEQEGHLVGRREDLKRLLTGQCASTGSGRRQEMCLDRSSDWREAVGASPCQQVGSSVRSVLCHLGREMAWSSLHLCTAEWRGQGLRCSQQVGEGQEENLEVDLVRRETDM